VKELDVAGMTIVTESPVVIKLTCPFGPNVYIPKLDVGSRDLGFVNPFNYIDKFKLFRPTLKQPCILIVLLVSPIEQVAIEKLAATKLTLPKVKSLGT